MKKDTITRRQSVILAKYIDFDNPMMNALQAIGGRWKLLLLDSIRRECPKRFGELRKKLEYITHSTLMAQLRELERDGILVREVFPEVPPRGV